MKTSTTTRHVVLATFVVLALAIPTTWVVRSADGKAASAAESSQLAKDMTGTWVFVGTPGHVGNAPATGGRLKFRTGRHWTLVSADPKTGLVVESFGGTYTLNGNDYVETQEYADATWLKDNGKSFKFTVKIEGDTMTQIGIDNPYTEVWKRLK